jgi:2-haloalkanoic acid dehalogenase type II
MAAYQLVAFDLYGTLLDFGGLAGRIAGLTALPAAEASSLLAAWRKAQVERTWTLNRLGRHEPFDVVTEAALAEVAPGLTPALRARLAGEWVTLPAFADAAPALAQLGAAGIRTAVLSNGTPALIESGLRGAALAVDRVLSVEQVGAYKTDPRVYALLDELAPREATLFVSANGWDADGARRDGRAACWIDRGGEPPGLAGAHVHSLAELAAQIAPPDWRAHGVRIVSGAELDPNTAQTPGMSRAAAITAAKAGAQRLWAGTVVIQPDARTGAHHHGELESVLYVVRGRARMRWGERLEFVAEAGPGDFIYVPPFVPHQEINARPGEELECVIVRSGQDPVVVNLDLPTVEPPEEVRWIDPIHRE